MFEVLNFAFVFSGGFEGVESAEIFAFVGPGVYFPGVDAVLSGFKFTYHSHIIFSDRIVNRTPWKQGPCCYSFRFIDSCRH